LNVGVQEVGVVLAREMIQQVTLAVVVVLAVLTHLGYLKPLI
jgi:hypothetical protein